MLWSDRASWLLLRCGDAFREAEGENVGAGRNCQILMAVHTVGERTGGDQIAGVVVPQRAAGVGIKHRHLTELFRRKDDAAFSGQKARTIMVGADLLVIPLDGAGFGVDRAG